MKVTFYMSIGYANSRREETLDTDDDLGIGDSPSDEKIAEAFETWKATHLDAGWSVNE